MKLLARRLILSYLRFITKSFINRHKIEIIGVTGSAGKTTLTKAIYTVLKNNYRVGYSAIKGKSLNSETGVPMALLNISLPDYSLLSWMKLMILASLRFIFYKPPYERFVLEMGVDKPNDMSFILSMVRPKTGVYLTISNTHTERFQLNHKRPPIEHLAEEKAKVIKSLEKDGWAVLNYDIDLIKNLSKFTKANVITFGFKEGADVKASGFELNQHGSKVKVEYKGQKDEMKIINFLAGKRQTSTMLAAIATGLTYKIPLNKCIQAIEKMSPPPGRMSMLKGIKNTTIIDSSYNASREPMFEALEILALFKDKKKIAVLGDMRELGDEAENEHKQVASKATKIATELVLVGPLMKQYLVPELLRLEFDKDKIHLFKNSIQAGDFLKEKLIKGGEAILFKGSQNTIFLEQAVEKVLANPDDNKQLCRRGKYWDEERKRNI